MSLHSRNGQRIGRFDFLEKMRYHNIKISVRGCSVIKEGWSMDLYHKERGFGGCMIRRMFQRKRWVAAAAAFAMCLTACAGRNAESSNTSFLMSNLADSQSKEEARAALSNVLPKENAERFLEFVTDYNETIENTGLTGGFEKEIPEYDIAAINALWVQKKGDAIGTNCRINTFALLKDTLHIPQKKGDDTLLFFDNDAIDSAGLFTEEEKVRFRYLFSRVETESTTDTQVHAKKMQEYLSQFEFSDKAKMVSVIIHDNLEGEHLFIGHVGVLVEAGDGWMFLEKISFEEPYQAWKFPDEEDCYRYLLKKFEDYSSETTAKPFIMVNDAFYSGV